MDRVDLHDPRKVASLWTLYVDIDCQKVHYILALMTFPGVTLQTDLLDPKLFLSFDTQCFHLPGTRHAVATEVQEPMLSIIAHITSGTSALIGSMGV